jgi:hypothetical protein
MSRNGGLVRVSLCVLGLVAVAGSAVAGEEGGEPGALGTAFYLQAGASSGSGNMGMAGGALGGSLVVDVAPRLSIEASGAWLGGGMGASDLTGSAALLLNVRRGGKAVPYLALGGGVYRSDSTGGSMMGAGMMNSSSSSMMGERRGAGSMMGGFGQGGMMGFDGGRMGSAGDGDARWGASTDPAVSVGGGLRIDVGSRVFVRPDARALIVLSEGGDSRTVGLFTASVGYRF